MKRLLYIILLLATSMVGFAQERTVQNRPYTDLRPFHFGVMVGTHLQDLEIANTGPQMVDLGDGNGPVQKVISVDQDRWDAGFTGGCIGRTAPEYDVSAAYSTYHVLRYTPPYFQKSDGLERQRATY